MARAAARGISISELLADIARNEEALPADLADMRAEGVGPWSAEALEEDARRLAEFERTRRVILSISGQAELIQGNPVLSRSIRLRNPYVDPMSLVQVDLLRRKRTGAPEESLNYALAATINGIAAGLHNTG